MQKSKRGKFITFEGGEGVGKTTQVEILKQYLMEKNIPVITTREPGGTPIAEEIRNILLEDFSTNSNEKDLDDEKGKTSISKEIDQVTEMFLLSAARADHIKKIIEPNLANGTWVICDRFVDSSFAYQGMENSCIDNDSMDIIQKIATNNLIPNLTLILDMHANDGLSRVALRGKNNKFDILGLNFHTKVRNNFLKIANLNPKRCKVIDAHNTMEEVSEQIETAINQHFPENLI